MDKQKNKIFLSYARDDDASEFWDTSKSFMRRLYNDLKDKFDVWWDRECLPSRGLSFGKEIQDAVAACDRLVLVMGPSALKSKYVQGEWQYARRVGICINPILRKGEFEAIPLELKRADIPDFRGETTLYEIALKQLVRQLSIPVPQPAHLHGVPALPEQYVLFRAQFDKIRESLLADLKEPDAPSRIVIYGMGGVGKSALATALAHNPSVRREYPDGVFWVEVGEERDILQLLYGLIQVFEPNISIQFPSALSAKLHLSKLLEQKNCLLILDNVWDFSIVESFDVLNQFSRVLITTRSGDWPHANTIFHQVDVLDNEQAKKLFARYAGEDIFPVMAEAVLGRCAGLPLALAIAGAMRRGGHSYEEISAYFESIDTVPEEYSIDYVGRKNVFQALNASISALQHQSKGDSINIYDLYLDFAVFPKAQAVPVSTVLKFWEHVGISRLQARQKIRLLTDRSLITNLDGEVGRASDTDHLLLHDLLYDCVYALAKNTLVNRHKRFLDAYRERNDTTDWAAVIQQTNDEYLTDHLVYHLKAAGCTDDIHALFCGCGWAKIRQRQGLIDNFRQAHLLLTKQDDIRHHIRYIAFSDIVRKSFSGFPVLALPVAVKRGWTNHDRLIDDLSSMHGTEEDRVHMYLEIVPTLSLDLQKRFAENVLNWAEGCELETVMRLLPYLPQEKNTKVYRIIWKKAFELGMAERQQIFDCLKLSVEQLALIKADILAIDDFYKRVNCLIQLKSLGGNIQDDIDCLWNEYQPERFGDYSDTKKFAYLVKFVSLNIRANERVWQALDAIQFWESVEFLDDIIKPLTPYVPPERLSLMWQRATNSAHSENDEESYWNCQVQILIALYYPTKTLPTGFKFEDDKATEAVKASIDLANNHLLNGVEQTNSLQQAINIVLNQYHIGSFLELEDWRQIVSKLPLSEIRNVWNQVISTLGQRQDDWFYANCTYALFALSECLPLDMIREACFQVVLAQHRVSIWYKFGERLWNELVDKLLKRLPAVQQNINWVDLLQVILDENIDDLDLRSRAGDSVYNAVTLAKSIAAEIRQEGIALIYDHIQDRESEEKRIQGLSYLCDLAPAFWIQAWQELTHPNTALKLHSSIQARLFVLLIKRYYQCESSLSPEDIGYIKTTVWDESVVKTMCHNLQYDDPQLAIVRFWLQYQFPDVIRVLENIHLPMILGELDKTPDHRYGDQWTFFLSAAVPLDIRMKFYRYFRIDEDWGVKYSALLKMCPNDMIWEMWYHLWQYVKDNKDKDSFYDYPYAEGAKTLTPFLAEEYVVPAWEKTLHLVYWPEICELLAARLPSEYIPIAWRTIEQLDAEKSGWFWSERLRKAMSPNLPDTFLLELARRSAEKNVLTTLLTYPFHQYVLESLKSQLENGHIKDENWGEINRHSGKIAYILYPFIYYYVAFPPVRYLLSAVVDTVYRWNMYRSGFRGCSLYWQDLLFETPEKMASLLFSRLFGFLNLEDKMHGKMLVGIGVGIYFLTFFLALIPAIVFNVIRFAAGTVAILAILIFLFPYTVWQLGVKRLPWKDLYLYLFLVLQTCSHIARQRSHSRSAAEQKVREAGSIAGLLDYRPYLQRIGGRELRKDVKQICDDAQSWWSEAIRFRIESKP